MSESETTKSSGESRLKSHLSSKFSDFELFEGETKAGIVFVHGLNNNLNLMRPLMNHFSEKGLTTLSMSLSGHGENCDQWPENAFSIWMEELEFAVDALAENCNVVFCVGFSLGAVLCLNLNNDSVKGKVLLSPPVFINPLAKLGRWIFRNRQFLFPSLVPSSIRAKRFSSSHSYHGIMDAIEQIDPKKVKNFLFIGDARDRLLNFRKLQEKFIHNEFVEVACTHFSRHNIPRPEYVSSSDWSRMTLKMQDYMVDQGAKFNE